MRTLLIVPSFLMIFAAVVMSLAWLISAGGNSTLSETRNFPSRAAFTSWNKQMPIGRRILESDLAEEDEHMEEGRMF